MKIGLGIVAGLLVIGLAVWWSMRPAADRFDYAAAFEQPTASPVAAGDVVDVKALAGRTEEEVAALLGAPAQCEKALHSRRCSYAQAPVEIVFIDGLRQRTAAAAGRAGAFRPAGERAGGV
jgi:hypothetical protein